jgi:hypothetical protein
MAVVMMSLTGLMVAGPAAAAPPPPPPSATALTQWWNAGRGDYYAAGTFDGNVSAIQNGYTQVRIEANVLSSQVAGSVPLYLFWNGSRQDNFTTATTAGIGSAFQYFYRQVRIEGMSTPPR